FHSAGVRNSRKQSTNERDGRRERRGLVLVLMSRSSPRVRDYTHGGKGRLFQLRQLIMGALQLTHKIVGNHDKQRPYTENQSRSVTGVGCHGLLDGMDRSRRAAGAPARRQLLVASVQLAN